MKRSQSLSLSLGTLAAIILSIVVGSIEAQAISTVTKIESSKETLSKNVKEQEEVNRHLHKIANDIEEAKKENQLLNVKLESLSQEYIENEAAYQESKKSLATYDDNLKQLNKDIREKNNHFITLLSQQFSVIHAMGQDHEPSRESIIKQEVYRLYREENAKELQKLKTQIDQWKNEREAIKRERVTVKKKINKLAVQRDAYQNEQEVKNKLLDKLASDEIAYRKKLQQTIDEQDSLRTTLASLNIIHKKEAEEERARAAAQKAAMIEEENQKIEERKQRKLARDVALKEGKKVVYEAEEPSKPRPVINNVNSSYSPSKANAYVGGKTISPIVGAKLIKGFGTYIDPVYKIKIFNESITLKAPSSDAKVLSVLNGKVVFAGSSSMLGNVVVVAHGGRVHTIYAGLSKIAPTIRVGSKVMKGYVIGKVSSKLVFEATQNSKHINPMKLISL